MEFPNITEADCPLADGELPEQPDDETGNQDCSNPDFAAAHPGLCPVSNRLVLTPERSGACANSPTAIQFRTFLSNTTMTELTSGVVYASSDSSVVAVNASSGEGVALAEGVATITATYAAESLTATATVTVLSGSDCCALVTTTNAVLVDNSESMGNPFDSTYTTLLALAKAMATSYMGDLTAGVDTSLIYSFHTVATQRSAVSDITLTSNPTNLKAAVDAILPVLNGATTERKVLIIFSDGANRPLLTLEEQNALVNACMEFKQNGGLIICIGLRAAGDGYKLLKLLTSGGFFLNVVDEPATAITQMNVLRSLVCLPACLTDGTLNAIPEMTGASTPSGTASASSDDGFNVAWMAFDGDDDTTWNSASAGPLPQSLIYQFPQARTIVAYGIIGSGLVTTPSEWTLAGSDDGSTWTTLDTQSGTFAQGELHRFDLDEAATYPYYRLRVTGTASPSNWTSVALLALYACRLGTFGAQVADPDALADVES